MQNKIKSVGQIFPKIGKCDILPPGDPPTNHQATIHLPNFPPE